MTLLHYDLPSYIGAEGWEKRETMAKFAAYCKRCFEIFGDRIPYYATINEPNHNSYCSYLVGNYPPNHVGDVQNLVNNLKESNPVLVDELTPKLLGLGEIQKVLQNLLEEGISIRDLLSIFESLADHAQTTRDTDVLTEYVRQSLKRAISSKYFPANETTSVITLDPKVEQEIMSSVKQTEQGAYLTLDPEKTKAIMDSVGTETQKLESIGKTPIIITSPIVRMYFKKLTEDYYKDLIVVSYNEVESNVELQSVGMVTA